MEQLIIMGKNKRDIMRKKIDKNYWTLIENKLQSMLSISDVV